MPADTLVSGSMRAVRLLGVSPHEWWRPVNHPRGEGWRRSKQKSLSLTPFSNLSHHSKIYCEAPPLPFSQTEAEPYQMSGCRDILVSSRAPRRFSSDAGVTAARLQQRSNPHRQNAEIRSKARLHWSLICASKLSCVTEAGANMARHGSVKSGPPVFVPDSSYQLLCWNLGNMQKM